MKDKNIVFIVAALVLTLIACSFQLYYDNTHIFVENAVYEKSLSTLDLRGTGVSMDHILQVQSQLPECEMTWELPFQGGFLAQDTARLRVTSLSDADVNALDHLSSLQYVDATDCRDYPQIRELMRRRPECQVAYRVQLGDALYAPGTQKLSLQDGDGEELLERLQYLPKLKGVHIEKPTMPVQMLLELVEKYPDIAFSWNVEILGNVYPSDTTAIDLSGTPLDGIEELEKALVYLPQLELLELHHCGVDYDVLAEYRERQADNYKVVWTVWLDWNNYIRTDETTFMPYKTFRGDLTDKSIVNLKYCNEIICVDVGHYRITHCDWAAYMPHLKYLIVADTKIRSIEGIRGLEELVYLETFTTPLKDYSPLLDVPNLKDLNAANSGADIEILVQLTSLERLWWSGTPCSSITLEERQRLKQAIPQCRFQFDIENSTSHGWRQGKLYYEMRDVLEMPYFA